MTDDEEIWKRRFLASMLARLGSLVIFLLGIVILFTDAVQPGGSPRFGAILVIIGAISSVIAPRLVRRRWERP